MRIYSSLSFHMILLKTRVIVSLVFQDCRLLHVCVFMNIINYLSDQQMYGPNTATENRSTLATDSTISRLSPVSRLILSILSVRASHQYNVFSWKVICKFISQSKPPRHFSYKRDEVGGTLYRRGEAGEEVGDSVCANVPHSQWKFHWAT